MSPPPPAAQLRRAWLFVGLGVLAAGLLLWRLADALTPVFVALLLAYLLDPLVDRMSARRLPRGAAAGLAVAGVSLLAVGLVLVVMPLLAHQAAMLAERVPSYVERVRDQVLPWIERSFGLRVPLTLDEWSTRLGGGAQEVAEKLVGPLGLLLTGIWAGLGGLVAALITVVLVPIFTFFLLRDFPRVSSFFAELVPPGYRDRVFAIAREIDRVVSAWIRGQLTVMATQGVLYAVGLTLIGIDFGVLIGVLAGVLAFIPYAGVSLGLLLALLTAVVDYRGPGQIAGVLVVFGGVQALDAVLITPRFLGDRTGLGPVGVIVALLIFGELFGFVGVLLAVPLAAAAVIVVRHLLVAYRASRVFASAAGPPGGAPGARPEPTEEVPDVRRSAGA